MKNMRKIEERPEVDVLILHGMSMDLVNYFKDLFKSLAITSATVVDLPSRGMAQSKKVDYYIKNCKVPLVLATHDEETGDITRARPNVYLEIQLCRKTRQKDLIVLQEKTVDLGSNVEGILVCIPFELGKIHLILPKLIGELKSREIFYRETRAEERIGVGKILNDFLDEMDDLWDNEFDIAWNKIHRLNYAAESNFALTLDKFFQQYHKVFDAVVRHRTSGDSLRQIVNASLDEARKFAVMAWEYVAEAKMKKIDEMTKTIDDSKKSLRHRRVYYEDASSYLRQGKRSESNKDKIEHFRKCIDLADKYISKLP